MERFLTLSEVRVMLKVSRSTLWRWIAAHGLKVVRVGSVTRIRKSDLESFLSRHETETGCTDSPQADATEVQSS